MTFLHTALFAAGAACIAIPIIIHLLMHRRRKPVMWGAMRFLVEAYKRQRRRLMVEKWLLLAARCLLLLLLAAAVGRPLLERLAGSGGGKTIYLLIDNGVASSARDGFGASALERHKSAAKAILATVRSAQSGGSESDRIGLIAMGGPSAGVVVPASANLGSIEALIEAMEPTDSRTDIPGALVLVSAAVGGTGDGAKTDTAAAERTLVVLLSDLTDGSADLSPGGDGLSAARLPEGVRLVVSEPASATIDNVAITSVEPLRSVLIDAARAGNTGGSDGSEMARVRLTRTGEGVSRAAASTIRARLALASGTTAKAIETPSPSEQVVVRWAPGQESAYAVVPVRADRALLGAARGSGAGNAGGEVVLVATIDDDAIGADNRWRRPIALREALRVGVVAPIRFGKAERVDALDAGSWARLALQPAGESGSAGIEVADIEPASLDQSRLAGLDAVILARPDLISEASWARIRLFIEGGGLALVTPPPGVTTHVWGDAMTRGLGVPWTPAREAKSVEGQRLRRVQGAEGKGESEAGVLALVEGELDELLSAVNIHRVLPLDSAADAGQSLLKTDDGTSVLWIGQVGRPSAAASGGESAATLKSNEAATRGALVYLGVPLDLEASDLPAKPLMVPLVQELVRQGVGRARGSWWSIAGSRPTVPARTTELRPLVDPARTGSRDSASSGPAYLPSIAESGGAAGPIRTAGVYSAVDERGTPRGIIAVNADPRGTSTNTQTREQLGVWLRGAVSAKTDAPGAPADASDVIAWIPAAKVESVTRAGSTPDASGVSSAVSALLGRGDRGVPISLPLLIGALALAVIEIFLARRASHAEIADGTFDRSTGAASGESTQDAATGGVAA